VTVIKGSFLAGPVIPGNGLEARAYDANGNLLAGPASVNANGGFTFNIPNTYNGVVLVRVTDTTPSADYRDEATNTNKDLSGLYDVSSGT
jgi:hypothetical protein